MPDASEDVGQLLRHQYASLVRAAYLLTGDRSTAHDLAQDTCVAALARAGSVVKADHPAAYLRKVLLNEFLGRRRRKRIGEIAVADVPEAPAVVEDPPDRERLRRALLALPPRQRAAVVLRHYEDRSEREVAAALDCSVGTVKSLTSRGLAALRLSLPTLEEIDR